MPVAGPFYLTYCNAGDAFDPSVHNLMEEYVYSARRTLREGEKPTLDLEIRNPRIGILNPTRKQWAWFAWTNPANGHIEPLFVGRVVAVPGGSRDEVIDVQFVAWPVDYFARVQALAETLRVPPFYDEVLIDVIKTDDPDTVLEARSALFCVDPITLAVTAEDILDASDGNVDVTADDALYDGYDLRIKQPPLTSILMDATFSWTQTARGFVDLGNEVIASYSGDGIVADWPKALQQLGADWSVQYGSASDSFRVNEALTASFTYSYTNTERTHGDGDTLSYTFTVSVPSLESPFLDYTLTKKIQNGVLDPFAVDGNGDPAPLNIPASVQATMAYVPLYSVVTSLTLRYDMARQRTERVLILLRADVQEVINDPLVTQYSKTITKTSRDVGVPIVHLLNSTAVRGTHVGVGQVIFPDNPSLPGGRSAQIVTEAGTTELTDPNFSDVVGDLAVDGGATWASMGTQNPTEGALDWTPVSHVPVGEIILPKYPLWTTWRAIAQTGLIQYPPVGVSVSLGTVVQSSSGVYFSVTLDGITGLVEPFGGVTTFGDVVVDGSAQWTCIGNVLPDGRTYYITPTGGVTGAQYVIPPFGAHATRHDSFSDGSVTWISVGPGDIPAGGTSGNVWARSYISGARGKPSIEYMLCELRANMRNRSRAVDVLFDVPFALGTTLNCRRTATYHDGRVPGGVALGKVTEAVLYVNGDTGENICHATIGCCVGKDTVVLTSPGVGAYALPGYMQAGYQYMHEAVITVTDLSDVAYTPPLAATNDDGLVLPLDRSQVVLSSGVKGATVAQQKTAVMSALASMARAAQVSQYPVRSLAESVANQRIVIEANANSVSRALQRNARYFEYTLRPLDVGPFFDVYRIETQPLSLPKGIDLAGAST